MSKNFNKNKYNSGVTLIELLVVIAILGIMSATTLVSYSNFKSSMSIQNLADDIALSLRKAQGFAVGTVRTYSNSYGVHFMMNSDLTKPISGSKKSFILFANIDNFSKYDTSNNMCGSPQSGNECLEMLQITSSDEIYKIVYGLAGYSGWREMEVRNGESIDVFFTRPHVEPTFCYKSNPDTSDCNEGADIGYIKIFVQSTRDPNNNKIITVWNNGQISVS